MNTKLSKKIFGILAVLLAVIIVPAFSGCAEKNIELYPGTWFTTNIELSEELRFQTFSVTVEYVGGDYYDHANEELVAGYIYINDEAYSLTFNIDGEEIVSTSSTYYGKELYGSIGFWRGHEFNFAGELYEEGGSTYFDGSLTIYATDEEVAGGSDYSIGGASFRLKELN